MPRKYRIVVPGKPHHVIQRGNRRQKVFFYPGDKILYLQLLKEQIKKNDVQILAYCLMDNHVHIVMVPETREGLAKAVAQTNRNFALKISKRYGWKGYLWQGRFISYVMDEIYLMRTIRYVENNPVRAKMIDHAWEYLWSSARVHVGTGTDELLSRFQTMDLIEDWKEYLRTDVVDDIIEQIRRRNLSGLPLGDDQFIDAIAQQEGLVLKDLQQRSVGRPKKL